MATYRETITVAVPPDVCFKYVQELDNRLKHLSNKLFQAVDEPTITSDSSDRTVVVSQSGVFWFWTFHFSTTITLVPHSAGTRAEIIVQNNCDWLEYLFLFPVKIMSKQHLLHVASELVALEAGYCAASSLEAAVQPIR